MNNIILNLILFPIYITISYSHYDEDHHLMKRFCAKDMSDAVLTKLQACDQFQTPWFINVTNNCLLSLNLGTSFKDRRKAKCAEKIRGKLMKCIRNGRNQQNCIHNNVNRNEKGRYSRGFGGYNRGSNEVSTVVRAGASNLSANGISNVVPTGIQKPNANRLSTVLINGGLNQSVNGVPNYKPMGITATNQVLIQSSRSTVNVVPNIGGLNTQIITNSRGNGSAVGSSSIVNNISAIAMSKQSLALRLSSNGTGYTITNPMTYIRANGTSIVVNNIDSRGTGQMNTNIRANIGGNNGVNGNIVGRANMLANIGGNAIGTTVVPIVRDESANIVKGNKGSYFGGYSDKNVNTGKVYFGGYKDGQIHNTGKLTVAGKTCDNKNSLTGSNLVAQRGNNIDVANGSSNIQVNIGESYGGNGSNMGANISRTYVGSIARNGSANVGNVGQGNQGSHSGSYDTGNISRNGNGHGKVEFGGYIKDHKKSGGNFDGYRNGENQSGNKKWAHSEGRIGHGGHGRKWEGQFEQCIRMALN